MPGLFSQAPPAKFMPGACGRLAISPILDCFQKWWHSLNLKCITGTVLKQLTVMYLLMQNLMQPSAAMLNVNSHWFCWLSSCQIRIMCYFYKSYGQFCCPPVTLYHPALSLSSKQPVWPAEICCGGLLPPCSFLWLTLNTLSNTLSGHFSQSD